MTPVSTCAVGGCKRPRAEGSMFCGQSHEDVPAAAPGRSKTPRAPRPATGAAALICPHCQTQGRVKSKQVKVKQGISGGKATGAVLTAGFSILATGLSRKHKMTQMHCGKCGTTWLV